MPERGSIALGVPGIPGIPVRAEARGRGPYSKRNVLDHRAQHLSRDV